jgi:hypothetical protein
LSTNMRTEPGITEAPASLKVAVMFGVWLEIVPRGVGEMGLMTSPLALGCEPEPAVNAGTTRKRRSAPSSRERIAHSDRA